MLMQRPRGTVRQCRHASAVVEMALVVPFIAFMFIVAVDYCRVFYCTQVLQNCAYVGSLYASGTVRADSATGRAAAAQQAALAEGACLSPPLQQENVAVSFSGNTTTVTVQYEFQTLTSLLGDSGKLLVTRTITAQVAPAPGQGNWSL
jgi:Flp pilus assembly protein TadG